MPLSLSKNNTSFPGLDQMQASLLRPKVRKAAEAMANAGVDLEVARWMEDSPNLLDRLVYAEAVRLQHKKDTADNDERKANP